MPYGTKAALVLLAVWLISCQIGLSEEAFQDRLSDGSSHLKLISEFEGGKLYYIGNLRVIELHGSYREMGRQYGALLKRDLNEIYDNISMDFGKAEGLSYQGILEYEREIFELYPQRYKEIIYGMAETSGLGLDKELIVNAQEYYMVMSPKCSAMAVWGNYTYSRSLIFGRNYDWSSKLTRYITVAVYNPNDGSIPTASITYAGGIYVTTGMNRDGLILETNGDISENMYFTSRVTDTISLFSFLENSANLRQLDAQIRSTNPSDGCILNAADEERAYSYEWSTFGVKRRDPDKDGLLVSTNHFVDPSWGIAMPQEGSRDTIFTAERRRNLLALAEKYKGNFTSDIMMKVMATPIKNGGPYGIPGLPSSYQVVAVPKERTIWVRVPGVQDWTKIQLEKLFSEGS